jgi:multidrug efflux pump subunit AcrA (membrane-fusion protein)
MRAEALKGLGVVLALLVLMLWLSGAFRHKVAPGFSPRGPRESAASTSAVELKTFPLSIEAVGTIETEVQARVAGRIMAQVREIPVKEGDLVRGPGPNGEPATILARLDDRDLQTRARQAREQLVAMERALDAARASSKAARSRTEAARANSRFTGADFARYEDLYRNRAATGQQLDQARSRKDSGDAALQEALHSVEAAESDLRRLEAQKGQAEAALAEARVTLGYAAISAPFSGKVVRKLADVGDTVGPGQAIFLVETSGLPELRAAVPESLASALRVGQEIEAGVDAAGASLTGAVREIAPRSDPASRTILVKVSLPPVPGLVAGLFGRLRIPVGEYRSLVIPSSAVKEIGQLEMVEVLDKEKRAERRFVTLGERHGDLVEVLSGLREGEEAIVR